MIGFLLATSFAVVFAAGCVAGWMGRRYLEVRTRYYYRRGYQTRNPQRTALAVEAEPVIDKESIVDESTRDIFAGLSMNGTHTD